MGARQKMFLTVWGRALGWQTYPSWASARFSALTFLVGRLTEVGRALFSRGELSARPRFFENFPRLVSSEISSGNVHLFFPPTITFPPSITWCTTRICLTAVVVAARRRALLTFSPFQSSGLPVVGGLRVGPACTGNVYLHFLKAAWLVSLIRYLEPKRCTSDASWRLCLHIKPPAAIFTSTSSSRLLPTAGCLSSWDRLVAGGKKKNQLHHLNRTWRESCLSCLPFSCSGLNKAAASLLCFACQLCSGVWWSNKCIWR